VRAIDRFYGFDGNDIAVIHLTHAAKQQATMLERPWRHYGSKEGLHGVHHVQTEVDGNRLTFRAP
jgi:hypothetical protein